MLTANPIHLNVLTESSEKKKGFKEGSVVMEREKVIFVKPSLPEEN